MRRLFVMAAILSALVGYVGTTAQAASPGVVMYGNWCGPGVGSYGLPPIDPLDTACMRHDTCYVVSGTAACECDVAFMREVRAIIYPNEQTYVQARAMYDALAMMPCDDPAGWALKQSLMWSDIADDALSGRATPFEVPARWMYLFSRSSPKY
ncbi:MAG TPA: hypothetical protein VIN57_03590 [Magnetovibrio sp.]